MKKSADARKIIKKYLRRVSFSTRINEFGNKYPGFCPNETIDDQSWNDMKKELIKIGWHVDNMTDMPVNGKIIGKDESKIVYEIF